MPNNVWFQVQYLLHSASELLKTWLVYIEVLGLYNVKVRSIYDVSSWRYETIHRKKKTSNQFMIPCTYCTRYGGPNQLWNHKLIKYDHSFAGFQSKSRETVIVLNRLWDDTSYIEQTLALYRSRTSIHTNQVLINSDALLRRYCTWNQTLFGKKKAHILRVFFTQ